MRVLREPDCSDYLVVDMPENTLHYARAPMK
jgi:hypothetical protein